MLVKVHAYPELYYINIKWLARYMNFRDLLSSGQGPLPGIVNHAPTI